MHDPRRGFALPFTIFLMTLMTLMLATAFVRAANEHQVATSTDAHVSALSIAEAGLDAFYHDTSTVRPADGDSVRVNVPGGYAWVYAHELQRPADTIAADVVYVIESRGTVIDANQGDAPQAVRSVVEFARWQVGSLQLPAIFTAANGLVRRGPSSSDGELTLMGADANQCPMTPAEPDQRQLRLPNTTPVIDSYSGLSPLEGGTRLQIANETGIDWDAIVNGPFEPDMYGVAWGDTTSFFSQMIVGDTTLNSLPSSALRGAGILIVTGNLILEGEGTNNEEISWHGIVLVGGWLDSRVNFFDVHGVIVTGLNELIGIQVTTPSVVAGRYPTSTSPEKDMDVLYDGCYVRAALDRLTGWVPVSRTRVDNWSTY